MWSLDHKTTIGFTLALALLISIGVISYRQLSNFEESTYRVIHTQNGLREIEALGSDLNDAESELRGFLLTNNRARLDPYREAVANVHKHLHNIQEVTESNPNQQARIATLNSQITEREKALNEAIDLRSQEGIEAALQRINADQGKDAIHSIELCLRWMAQDEHALLAQHSEASKANGRNTVLATIFSSVLASIFLIVAMLLVNSNILGRRLAAQQLRQAHDELEIRVRKRTADLALANDVLLNEITDRKQVEESLRQSEDRYRQLVELSPLGILIHCENKINFVNKAAVKLLGASFPEDLVGKPVLDFVHSEQQALVQDRIRQTQENQQLLEPVEEKLIRLDNTVLTAEVVASPFLFQGRAGTQVLFRDITEHKLLENQLRQAQKMEAVGRLAGGVAHDFNNLLTVILGYSELLLSRADLHATSRELLREIRKSGERAASLTRQLLAFSRQQVLAPVVLDLNQVVEEIDKMIRRLIGEDIDVATILDPGLGQVKVDPGQMEQVIMNLVVNARDAMPTGGHLTIETHNVVLDEAYSQEHQEVFSGPYVLLAVSDTGTGMDAQTRKNIFEPFFTTKEVGKGTGLGLAMVYGIIKQSGGHIQVYSEVGHGTTFKIYLPRLEGAVPISTADSGQFRFPKGRETVLLVEDEEGVRALSRMILESNGYSLLEASNGQEALMVASQYTGPIHLLVTDVVMPKMGGRVLADQLLPLRPDLKVLYLSGYTDDAVVRHGVLGTGLAFLQKPFPAAALARTVRELLDVTK